MYGSNHKTSHQRNPLTFYLTLGKNPVVQVREHRVLGLTFYEELKWKYQIIFANIYPIICFCSLNSGTMWIVKLIKTKIKFQEHLLPHNYKLCIYCLEWLNSLYRRAAKLILPDQHLSTPPYLKDFLQRAPYGMGQITLFYHFLVLTCLTRVLPFLVAQPGTRSYTQIENI